MVKFNETRTYGIEIEFSFGERSRGISASQMARLLTDGGVPTVDAGYSHSTMATWKIVTDGSVHNGLELVSPPMSGIESRETLRAALRIIKENGARTHRSCGIHVHQYVGDLTNAKQLANVVELYKSHEPIIDQFFAESRRNSRWCKSMHNGINHYENAAALRTNVLPAVGITGRNTTASTIINAITNGDRYYKVNYMAYQRQATVEFRQHHSSLNINKLWSWIVFTQMIVETAATHRGKIRGRIVRTGNQETAAVRSLVRELGMHKRFYQLDGSENYDEITLDATQRLLKRLPSNITVRLRSDVAVNDETDSVAVTTDNGNDDAAVPADASDVYCPICGFGMILRTNNQNGNQFWGCSRFGRYGCRGSRQVAVEQESSAVRGQRSDEQIARELEATSGISNNRPEIRSAMEAANGGPAIDYDYGRTEV